jgi:hypothetical protein
LEALMIDEHATHVNALGIKGVGEIGITDTAGAVANAVWQATGIRVRRFLIRIDDLVMLLRIRYRFPFTAGVTVSSSGLVCFPADAKCPELARPGCCERGRAIPLCTGSSDVNGSATLERVHRQFRRRDIAQRCRSSSAAATAQLGTTPALGGDFVLCAAIPFAA